MTTAKATAEHPIDAATLRAKQRPLKDAYREDPAKALVTSTATAEATFDSISATVPGWAGPLRAGLHPATGGDGSEACSADILLESLVACAGVTLRSVAVALGIELRRATVTASGTWDARGTLGVDKEAPVGLSAIRVEVDLDTDADGPTVQRLLELTERYCVIAQTLRTPPELTIARA